MTPVRYGMVGGGPGAFIGAVHRMAAALDGRFLLCAGAFSSDRAKSAEQGRALGLDPARVYGSWEEMVEVEARLPEEERIEVAVIVTPNHLHYPQSRAFLEAGFHVVCDKPLTTSGADADELARLAGEKGLLFCVTYNYSGYPMVKEARARIAAGELGELRRIVVEYSQGWLRTLLEAEGQKQASWRSDPTKAGPASALGDIGSHAFHLAEYVTGLRPERVFADLATHVDGRVMEDDATVLLHYENGARGLLTAVQTATGERNHLRLRVYGSEAALDWCQERPDRLRLVAPDGTETILHDGVSGLSEGSRAFQRLPAGHPEGFIEAFGNLYRAVADTLRPEGGREGRSALAGDFPGVEEGAKGVHFIEKAVESARAGGWVEL